MEENNEVTKKEIARDYKGREISQNVARDFLKKIETNK